MAQSGGPGGFSVAARLDDATDIGTGTTAAAPERRQVRINGASAAVNSLGERMAVLNPTPAGPSHQARAFANRILDLYFDQIYRPRALAAPPRRACGEELPRPDADPGAGHPDRAHRARPARHRPDRHRQDRGVHAAVARPARQSARPPDRQARADARPRPDPRARLADRRERAHLCPQHQPHHRRDLRRHRAQQERS